MPTHESPRCELDRMIDAAAHYLPAQGPIDVFIHHNTLHAFEGEPFEEAVVRAARLFGTEPFLPESRYREELSRGRIRESDIDAVLDAEGPHLVETLLAGGRVSLRAVHRALLLHPVRQESDAAVRWTLTESDVLERLRPDLPPEIRRRLVRGDGRVDGGIEPSLPDVDDERARRTTYERSIPRGHANDERRAAGELWHACVEAAAMSRPGVRHVRPPVRHRDLILAVDRELDTDLLVNPFLIRVCGAFLDQGVASWAMPDRASGLFRAVATLYATADGSGRSWIAGLPAAFREAADRPVEDVIEGEISRLGVPDAHRQEFITDSLLALRGWAGMIRHLEERPDRAPVQRVPARLSDFLALRLVCDRVAAEWAAGRIGGGRGSPAGGPSGDLPGLWSELRDRFPPQRGPGSLARAFLLHQVSQLLGLGGHDIRSLDDEERMRFESAIAAFDPVARRRLFHLAYERRHRNGILDALASHAAFARPPAGESTAQVVLCIDERCESFRRHMEELEPGCESFGAAGFFAVPMYYRGVDDWHATPLCPIVMRPSHTVLEVPEASFAARHERRRSLRRRLGQVSGSLSAGTRTLWRGVFTTVAGAVAAIPLVARVAFPRLSARLARKAVGLSQRPIATRLDIDRRPEPGFVADTHAGFEVSEMAAMVRRLLEDIGLTSRFARIVGVLGHGSSSRNNPHESAYDCGACGGGRGGPNARAFALMANDERVRAALAEGGFAVPETTRFVGGMLDTCADSVTWYDVDLVPASHADDISRLRSLCDEAAIANAHERCRRFETAPLDIEPADALAHVEARSFDLAQVRPELGHATNAVCVIGRRWRTRGLFLDRRAFLVSYDPGGDPDAEILARTLAAVGPVGAGINLEYFFSTVDRVGYGSGTKLPHNITGLIGVMDGHASDLRTGLPWQMVEIHEPVRLLVVVDASPEAVLLAAARVPNVMRMAVNRWIQLVSWDPATGKLALFGGGGFEPYLADPARMPVADRSADWYSGHREHLPPARILAALAGRSGAGGASR